MEVNVKYLKDENKEIISPVTSITSCVNRDGIGINNNFQYKTEECDTGKIWVDGHHIYRQIVTTSTGNFSNNSYPSISIPHLSQPISIYGWFHSSGNGNYYLVPCDELQFWINSNKTVIINVRGDWSNGYFLYIIEYTKTN